MREGEESEKKKGGERVRGGGRRREGEKEGDCRAEVGRQTDHLRIMSLGVSSSVFLTEDPDEADWHK